MSQKLMFYYKFLSQTLADLLVSVPTKPIFLANWRYVGARANIFGNTVNIALENSTNLWKYDIWYTLILDWYEILDT